MTKQEFGVSGMVCAGCERSVTRILSAVEGVQEVKTSLEPSARVEIISAAPIERGVFDEALRNASNGRYALVGAE
jgi:copper chaperone CopZ